MQEKIIDYTTNCVPSAAVINQYGDCAGFLEDENNTDLNRVCPCTRNFTLDEDFRVFLIDTVVVLQNLFDFEPSLNVMRSVFVQKKDYMMHLQGQVYMYYGLKKYYQSHRRYATSRDDNQLNGQKTYADALSTNCMPYEKPSSENSSGSGFSPCGAIANSLFNGKLRNVCLHTNVTSLGFFFYHVNHGFRSLSDHTCAVFTVCDKKRNVSPNVAALQENVKTWTVFANNVILVTW